ncbi:MAG: hypothetical protein KDA72_17595, partial [Planctomycetales bacterium]|nr:hypothetical protein [Planctomycetales bacterium]
MKIDPLQKNDIVTRWKSGQSIRAISRELGLGRHVIASVISQHVSQTQAVDAPSRPASLGPIRLTRKSKLDAFIEPLGQLLERYPQLTAQRAFEELRQLGYGGSYTSVRNQVKAL